MTQPPVSFDPIVADEDDEDAPVAVKAPVVEGKADRFNPEVEYEVLDLAGLAPAALKARLNELGAIGWQLVATAPAFVFRRLKATETKPKAKVGF